MAPFFCREHLPKSVEKVILFKKVPKIDRCFSRIFWKYRARNHRKRWFSIFGLVHVDVKLHEDSESDLIFSNFLRKSSQKRWFIARFGFISIHSKMGKFITNPCFWPLLHHKMQKIRSDSESSSNFTSTFTKPKIENQFFPWFRAQYF